MGRYSKLLSFLVLTVTTLGGAVPVYPQDKSKEGMVRVAGGAFDLGTDPADIPQLLKTFNVTRADIFSGEAPRHRVRVDPFYIDTHEVTNAQFKQFIDKNPNWQADKIPARLHNGKYLKHWNGNEFPKDLAAHPVVNVSWYAAVAYCQSQGKRLPTEAEWDYAARGGLNGKMYPWGDEPADKNRANYAASGVGAARPVGSYAPNGYGLYDMAGNVWEYTADEWKAYPADILLQVNPVAGGNFFLNDSYLQVTTRRVIRGGSWGGAPINLRVAYRDSHPAEGAGDHVGFRCAEPVGNSTIKLAAGQGVTIDGKIDEKEWAGSTSFDLKGGGRVFFKYDGEYLYAGVRGAGSGWSHLYLNYDNDPGVLVHHASAALGMTTYRPDKDQKWQFSNPFAWALRDRVVNDETQKKMNDYLSKNSWVASNNNMGNKNETEFKVKPRSGSIRVAVVYAVDAADPHFFPDTLRDDTVKEDLVRGNLPAGLKFDPDQWANIVLTDKK